ncbi:hypothetical protein GOP56_20970 [Brevibacillus sp. 7WMA2]|uniref:hypothetical protein n=1 Tax=Brevibacillus sp. 7WMA2 TaxID=2683193 RepID=UPI0013A715D8|nr:hypothetical protein [Brevibacillus sp. 7WMA2]QIC07824.1 hypothetical protein GOP56_20970 [Brevibacillus sp. 7WMA2]
MGRFRITGMLVMMMFLLVQGCSTPSSTSTMEQQALEIAMNFKKGQYEVGDFKTEKDVQKMNVTELAAMNDAVKPYLTEKAFESHVKNREQLLSYDVARGRQANIKLKKLTMEKAAEEMDKITYHYNMELELAYADGKQNKVITTNGQMDLVKEGEQWKIARDYDANPLIEEYNAIHNP